MTFHQQTFPEGNIPLSDDGERTLLAKILNVLIEIDAKTP